MKTGGGTLILSATLTTLLLSLAALAVGAGVGGVIAAAKLSRHAPARWFGAARSVVFRGIPELLVIYLFYFGGSGMISWLGRLFGADGFIEVPPFLIGALAIGLISSSYQAEVYRAARLALMPGKWRRLPPLACRAGGSCSASCCRRLSVIRCRVCPTSGK